MSDKPPLTNEKLESLKELSRYWRIYSDPRGMAACYIDELIDELTRLRTTLAASELSRERLKAALPTFCENGQPFEWPSKELVDELLTQPPSDVLRDALGPIEDKLRIIDDFFERMYGPRDYESSPGIKLACDSTKEALAELKRLRGDK